MKWSTEFVRFRFTRNGATIKRRGVANCYRAPNDFRRNVSDSVRLTPNARSLQWRAGLLARPQSVFHSPGARASFDSWARNVIGSGVEDKRPVVCAHTRSLEVHSPGGPVVVSQGCERMERTMSLFQSPERATGRPTMIAPSQSSVLSPSGLPWVAHPWLKTASSPRRDRTKGGTCDAKTSQISICFATCFARLDTELRNLRTSRGNCFATWFANCFAWQGGVTYSVQNQPSDSELALWLSQ